MKQKSKIKVLPKLSAGSALKQIRDEKRAVDKYVMENRDLIFKEEHICTIPVDFMKRVFLLLGKYDLIACAMELTLTCEKGKKLCT